jgi:formylglycine-generating enzyme required for sulfatase activity
MAIDEWVEDCWHEGYNGAPANGSIWGGGDCGFHLLRGGSWYADAGSLRAAGRIGWSAEDRNETIGFRTARPVTR